MSQEGIHEYASAIQLYIWYFEARKIELIKYERTATCRLGANVSIKMIYGQIHTSMNWESALVFSFNCITLLWKHYYWSTFTFLIEDL